MVSDGAVCVSGCQSVCPHWLQPLPLVLGTFSAGQDLQVCSCSLWCLLQRAGGWRPPAARESHGLLLDRVRRGRGRHSASGGHHAPSLAVSGMAESEGF